MGARTTTMTILFTDVVGSTARRARLGDGVADRLDVEHERLLGEVIAEHNGQVVKGLGDGVMAAFDSAADAVTAAIALQRACLESNRRHPAEHATNIRIGFSTGDVTIDERDDFRGTPVVEASRLCAAAEADHILCSDLARLLAKGRVSDVFSASTPHTLKGLSEPVDACVVAWQPAAADRVLPEALRGFQRFAFVGRSTELELLERAWKRAREGERPVVLVGGEPGLGKTRLSAELADRVLASNGIVLAGRCEEDLEVPFQPFVEALRVYAQSDAPLDLGPDAGELVRLWPGLRERVGDLAEPTRTDPETERYRLFEAVAGWLGAVTAVAPVLFVLDDLHWATPPTLHLLRHVVRSGAPTRLMILVTYRDTEAAGEVADVFADLRRDGAERLALGGLDQSGVSELLMAAGNQDLDDRAEELAAALHNETRGNPFFIGEVLTHLAETGAIYREDGRWTSDLDAADIAIPESVRDVVARRLGRLRPETNELLQLAAVVGRDFGLGVVAHASGDADAAIEYLDEAVTAGLVEETGVGLYRFAHALVRDTLYDRIPVTRRARIHRTIGEALEATSGHAVEEVLGELARHFAAAVVPGDAERAIDYSRRAGDAARARLAFDEAAVQYRRALEVCDAAPGAAPLATRCDLMICLGEALRWAAADNARQVEDEAVEMAMQAGDAELLTRAVYLNPARDTYTLLGEVDEARVALMRTALEKTPPTDLANRARLLASLAGELAFAPDKRAEREATADEALSLARSLDDLDVLAHVLQLRFSAYWHPDGFAERGRIIQASRELDARRGGGTRSTLSDEIELTYCLESGNGAGVEAAMARIEETAAREKLLYGAYVLYQSRSRMAHLAGNLDEAEALRNEAFALEQNVRDDAFDNYVVAIYSLRAEQDRLGEIVDMALDYAANLENLPALRATLPYSLAICGRDAEAREFYKEFQESNFALPFDPGWSGGTSALVRAAHVLEDVEGARLMYASLSPFPDQAVATGLYYMGSFQHWLGLAAATFGDHELSLRHFRAAEAWERGLRAELWTAEALLGQAEAHAALGDASTAQRIATETLAKVTALGGRAAARRAENFLAGLA